MVNVNELNLLSVDFNAATAINNLESVLLPQHTQSLDNLNKAALLLPFAIQKELRLFDKCDTSSENIGDENLDKNKATTERQLNVIRNIEFKLNLKKKFFNKKNIFNSVSNVITDKFSIQPKKYFFRSEEKKKNDFYDYLTRKGVSILDYSSHNYFPLVFR
ncbi:uncharacterized protein ELE39_001259 [Cryptosporidium sp. chipmunk genotype I]|uniref:uncharacterized protein n=1 Tax=Cryptosporidium sp. chipmunk genotype I TaxID=1280935 RepID=UPI00351A74B8|nr:hypothetical protein ELE39_001259 [Cryptosporidium sp. chipmunk genotype I]